VITLSARRLGEGTALSVHDDGRGISAALLPHAAERFRRGESSRSGPGTGLGLALVDAIAIAHGGQLRICSQDRHQHRPAQHPQLEREACIHPDAGTTVSLLLPGAAPVGAR
jgi:two-component system OmpR family sensor kinase